MRDEFVVMEHVKEALCFVSPDVRADLAAAARRDSPHRREFVLPDGVKNLRGFVREPEDAPADAEAEGAAYACCQSSVSVSHDVAHLPRSACLITVSSRITLVVSQSKAESAD